MARHARIAALAGMIGMALFVSLVQAGGNSETKVKVTAAATKPDADGKQVITVTFEPEEGWHIYANPVDNEDYKDNKTEVLIDARIKPVSVQVQYPPGKFNEDRLKVYEGKTIIRAAVQRAADDADSVRVTVTFYACTDKKCLPKGTKKFTLP